MRIAIASSILENNIKVDKKLIEEIKESIRKDTFNLLKELKRRKEKSRDIFYKVGINYGQYYMSFFYSPKDIREIKDKLYKIADHLLIN